ncbi:glycosyl hydrolase family 92-domain-containing protein [Scheffersomyces coipomensis]|uniref:glycosyl hydrolase family 92-domain-containing protein n=1 Tax=Scheffersomyces coipomensis TaxID=1788519 RepID=UPI00315D7BA5
MSILLFLKLLVVQFTLYSPIPKVNIKVSNPLDYVDLFYGTEAGGHMFPGVTRPFGMAKVGIDVVGDGDAYSGFAPHGHVNGISMMHESGTGGAPEYGVVSQLPFQSNFDIRNLPSLTRQGHDIAQVGYYNFNSTDNIIVEFSGAEKSGIFKYTFPPESTNPQVLIDVCHHLAAPGRPQWTQYFVNGSIESNKDLSGYTGYTTIKGGWGGQTPWRIYFCGKFNNPAISIISFENKHVEPNKLSSSTNRQNEPMGLVYTFNQSQSIIESKVGISYISTERACQHLNNELGEPDEYDLMSVVNETQQIWLDEVFDKVSISDTNSTLTSFIYTSLYGSHLMPTNKTGENPYWAENYVEEGNPVPTYYDDWFTLWDTFRTMNPLINILNPIRGSELINSLIEIYKHDGFTPDGRSANQNGRTQGGSNSDIIIADAFVKNITGVNWSDAFDAMVQNAEVVPPYWRDNFAPDSSTKQGRGALPDWLTYGYITRNFSRSVSRTMEYSYDDFALSVVAKGLGNDTAYEKYLRRSSNWQNIWNFDKDISINSYKGFIQPKKSTGEFDYHNYDPLSCGGCYWNDDEYEGKPIEYGWTVPFDMTTLISFIGSNETFITRLNDMYALHGHNPQIVDVGNEPSFTTPFLYNYVNQQYRSVELIRYIVDRHFGLGAKGLPGNSDSGAMQSWLFFSLMGLYPIAGTTTYLITSPFLPYLSINLPNTNKPLELIATNLTETNIYISELYVNGEIYTQNWIDHHTLFDIEGCLIEFELSDIPSIWELGDEPPSPGHFKR